MDTEITPEVAVEPPKKTAKEVLTDALRNKEVPYMPLLRDYLRVRQSLRLANVSAPNVDRFTFATLVAFGGLNKVKPLTRKQRNTIAFEARVQKRADLEVARAAALEAHITSLKEEATNEVQEETGSDRSNTVVQGGGSSEG